MSKSILQQKSYAFALRLAKLHDFIFRETNTFALANQIIRSGTSIGANVMEVTQAESRADFIQKLSISNKKHLKLNTGCVCRVIREKSRGKGRLR